MPETDFEITPFPIQGASQSEYSALNHHINIIRHERLPDDPPVPLEETISNLQSIPPFVDLRLWVVWDLGQATIVAMGNVALLRVEENRHVTQFDLTVHPDYRLQGLGSCLLKLIAETAQEDHRRLLITQTVDRIPGGEAFMKRLEAQKGMEGHTNQLRVADLNRELLQGWLSKGQTLQAGFDIGFWEGPYPEEKIKEIAELYDLENQQPLGDLQIEARHITPEEIRQNEKNIFARGNRRWTCYVVDRDSGKFAGYTETIWNPNRPEILLQEMTGVFPQFRNQGLGRWLKATMLEKVIQECPQIRFVRTGNADSNAAMLKINRELGFKHYMADTFWQMEVQKVMDYLSARNL
jgi:mycothiol synthase